MKCKRLIASLALCAVLAGFALPTPAAAAVPSRTSAAPDRTAAEHADILQLMGIPFGPQGSGFVPAAQLTRAEFCVMVIEAMGRGGEVAAHSTRTIFRDVTARHWARGYINLAASLPAGGSDAGRLITGIGNGQFTPDAPIPFAQAVTVLVRVLGYSDADAGAIWPAGYLNLAEAAGLTTDISAAPFASVTHAQAAQLFVNLLTAKTKAGQPYGATLGSTVKDVLILAVNVTGEKGSTGAVRTSGGVYQTAAKTVLPLSLQGRRGTLVLNERQEIITLIPDESTAVSVTLSGNAQATRVRDDRGTWYSIAGDTTVFTDGDAQSSWAKQWMDLRSGSRITLFLEGGKVTAVYCPTDGLSAAEAIVAAGSVDEAAILRLTGGAVPTVRKDSEVITLADIKPYDVITYSPASNTLTVSDLRLSCVYETASPNPETPETITVLGHEFPVLDSAADSIANFKIGQRVVLLLTADGKVAGMVSPDAASSTLTGLSTASGVSVDLPYGRQLELKGAVPQALQNRVVTVSGSKGSTLQVSAVAGGSVPGDLILAEKRLGKLPVAAGVRIYEQTGGSAMVALDPAVLETEIIAKAQIAAYQCNSSGMVDLIVLNAVTGDAYTYGILKKGSASDYQAGLSTVNPTVRVVSGSGSGAEAISAKSFADGAFGGVAVGSRVIGGVPVAADVVQLTAVSGVKRTDFFESDGLWFVSVGGAVYQVSTGVEGYIASTGVWFTQSEDRLAAIRAYSNDLTLHIDPIGHKVRIISVA